VPFENIYPPAFEVLFAKNTPNAIMADRWVVARDELHESEASWASMFCFDRKVLLRRRVGVLSFALNKSFCVRKYYQN